MASPYTMALELADVAIDQKMGEQIRITPLVRSDFDRRVDPDRSVIHVVALVDFVDPSSADIARLDARVPFEEISVEIRRSLLPPGFQVRKGDEVALLDRPGSPTYKVGRPDFDDVSRLSFTLSKVGPHP